MMVLAALARAGACGKSASTEMHTMFKRALRWLLSFQCRDGGWAAFDKEVTQSWLEDVPFADHNAILDPTCSDLTGRTLELLGYIGYDRESTVVRRALKFLRVTQEDDGSWYGRWGVNYIYGTWQVLRGLRAIGEDMRQQWIVRARDWLESCQNEDGGWGETCASYDDPTLKGKGPSTASQTAWAVMGLIAAADPTEPAALDRKSIRLGVEYLLATQVADGSWMEPEVTGTGFPSVFYLRYDMYRNNWPLLALATFRKQRSGGRALPVESRGHLSFVRACGTPGRERRSCGNQRSAALHRATRDRGIGLLSGRVGVPPAVSGVPPESCGREPSVAVAPTWACLLAGTRPAV